MSDPRDYGTLADVYEPLPETDRPAPALEPVDDLGAIWSASRVYSRPDRGDSESLRLTRGFEPILDALNAGRPDEQQLVDPGLWVALGGNLESDGGAMERRPSRRESWDPRSWVRDRVTVRQQMKIIFDEVSARRKTDPAFLPGIPEKWEDYYSHLIKRDQTERAAAASTLARSRGVGATLTSFGAGAVELMHDPLNVATIPLGGGIGGSKTLLATAGRAFLLNSAIEAVQIPGVAANREKLGEKLTTGEAVSNVVTAGAVGAGLHVATTGGAHLAGLGYDWTVGKVFDAMPASVQAKWASRMTVEGMPIADFYASLSHGQAADFAQDLIGRDRLSVDERAAIATIEAIEQTGSVSPFVPGPAGDAAHDARLATTLRALMEDRPLPQERPLGRAAADGAVAGIVPTPRDVVQPSATSTGGGRLQSLTAGEAMDRFKGKVRAAESGGNDAAVNARSSARGRYQFTDGTWLDYYRRRFGDNESKAQILAKKTDPALQERLMDDLTHDNAALLQGKGEDVTPGNLYLVHFMGPAALRVLKAEPSTPVARILPESFIAANPEVLGNKSASEVVAWAHRKMGGSAASVPTRPGVIGGIAAGDDFAAAQLRAEALRLNQVAIGETPLPAGGTLPGMRSITLDPSQIKVDAGRFQFKGGGDEFGVTERLRGVTEWNPIYAGRAVLWEDAGGSIYVADGHQRVGLARRIQEQSGTPIQIDGILMREADGVTAEDARTWAALKNIAEGTGSAVDAAKVIRQVGPEVLDHLPPKSALVRDGAALSRLSDEAFGAVYNEVLPADLAAVIGHLLPDNQAAHAGMVDLLVKLDPANRGQAESIVRQAIAAGFHKAEQVELFGTREVTSSLFLERAKVLERGLAELRKLRGVFGTAARNADTLEGAGSKIARNQAEQEATRNAQAIEIVARQAFSKGSVVADALNRAAAELASGKRLADVVGRFVKDVRKIDIGSLERAGSGDSGRLVPDGAGRGGDAGTAGDDIPGQSGDPGQPSFLELSHAAERFSDPNGPAAREQSESLFHDFKADLQNSTSRAPAIAARQAEDLRLRGQAPLRGENVTGEAQDGTMGLALFDRADEPGLDLEGLTFRLDDVADREISAADLLGELEADDAAIAAIKGCL